MRFYSKDVTPYYTIDNHVIIPSGIYSAESEQPWSGDGQQFIWA